MGASLPFVDLGSSNGFALNVSHTATVPVSCGDLHCCAVLAMVPRTVKCWGSSEWGQLGLGDTVQRGQMPATMGNALPTVALGSDSVQSVAVGSFHSCVLFDSGKVKCWGRNTDGQLGLGDKQHRGRTAADMTALPYVDLKTNIATALSAGDGLTCAVASGRVWCWGLARVTGLRRAQDALQPAKVDLDYSAGPPLVMSCGRLHSCAYFGAASGLKCWGENGADRPLGYPDDSNRGAVANVDDMGSKLPLVDFGTRNGLLIGGIALGFKHSCVQMHTSGGARAFCFGANGRGQAGIMLGDAVIAPSTTPADYVMLLGSSAQWEGVVQITSGHDHSCAVVSTPIWQVKCWGSGGAGQLGYESGSDRGVPGKDLSSVVDVGDCIAGPSLSPSAAPTAVPSVPPPSASPVLCSRLGVARAAMSSTYTWTGRGQCVADFCIDGLTTHSQQGKECGTMCQTDDSVREAAWLRLDLSEARAVCKVDVVNRQECCWERLGYHEIWVGTNTTSPVGAGNRMCSSMTWPNQAGVAEHSGFICTGSSVYVYLPLRNLTSRILGLAEVMVYGTLLPTAAPTSAPSQPPLPYPTAAPSPAPSGSPTAAPTRLPSGAPSAAPTRGPTEGPAVDPTPNPSPAPSLPPSPGPSGAPSAGPSQAPARSPSASPTSQAPSATPSAATAAPSRAPSRAPSSAPARPTDSPSSAPSSAPSAAPAAPSNAPSAAPSAAPAWPSRSPSAVPSRASVSPSGGPSAAPSVAPSAAPSDSPSAPPSDAPSAAPLAPSRAPSRAPSAAPARPSASPSPAPSAAPAAPSGAPATAPSAAPSWSPAPPTGAPTPGALPPSTAPTTSPGLLSGPPTAAPSAAPTRAVAPEGQAAAGIAGTVSFVLADGGGAASSARLALLAGACDDSISVVLHPTQLSLSGMPRPLHAGCVLWNILLAAALLLLHAAVAQLIGLCLGSAIEGQAAVRFPSHSLIPAGLLFQGGAFAGGVLARSGGGGAALGSAAMLAAAALCPAVLIAGRWSQPRAAYKLDRCTQGGCRRLVLGPGDWLPLRGQQVSRWGSVFRAQLPGLHAVIALELGVAAVDAMTAGLAGTSCTGCAVRRGVDGAAALAVFGALVTLCPCSRPLRVPLLAISQIFIAAGALASMAGYLSRQCSTYGHSGQSLPGQSFAALCTTTGGLFLVLAMLVDGAAVLWSTLLRRRSRLGTELAHLVTACRASATLGDQLGAAEAELRAALAAAYGAGGYPPPAPGGFEALFGAGRPSQAPLPELLAAEHLFWAAAGAPGAYTELAPAAAPARAGGLPPADAPQDPGGGAFADLRDTLHSSVLQSTVDNYSMATSVLSVLPADPPTQSRRRQHHRGGLRSAGALPRLNSRASGRTERGLPSPTRRGESPPRSLPPGPRSPRAGTASRRDSPRAQAASTRGTSSLRLHHRSSPQGDASWRMFALQPQGQRDLRLSESAPRSSQFGSSRSRRAPLAVPV
eukprot:TRINITY_DN14360_c0_g1_i6.p1 TRINITY_DN14360_c0_g1~~TRINITY_DN14360_c0_g1_i6.p1  ORF type:complete len:1571 (+),score=241.62 TRINITY_DN14360_c0_g1_i6:293-4714(+)